MQSVSKSTADISENSIYKSMPHILEILLIDRTKSTSRYTKHIIWANDNYKRYGIEGYSPESEIQAHLITGRRGQLIRPRALKGKIEQKERTKSKAEVFTPTWIVKMQVDAVDENYADDTLEEYTRRKWLEITCGEGPYMATRYDMDTGELIPLKERVGFVDRKLRRINREVKDKAEWQRLVEIAYQSSYGFEWNGDSLLLARENLLYTYRDYYKAKWKQEPSEGLLTNIAEIISYNIFQMDGLTYTVPLSQKKERVMYYEESLFGDEPKEEWVIHPGRKVKIMNWDKNKMELFEKGVK